MNRYELLQKTFKESCKEVPFHYFIKPRWFDEDVNTEKLIFEVKAVAKKVVEDLDTLKDLFADSGEYAVARQAYLMGESLSDIVHSASVCMAGSHAIKSVFPKKHYLRSATIGEKDVVVRVVGSIEKVFSLVTILNKNRFRYQLYSLREESKYERIH